MRKLALVFLLLGSVVMLWAQGDGKSCAGSPTLCDVDGNSYRTVQIGKQCWMGENLRTTRYADGTAIPEGSTSDFDKPYRYFPANDRQNAAQYGLLYNWQAASRGLHSSKTPSHVQGICPDGWHLPSSGEWSELLDYVGSKTAYRLDNNKLAIGKSLAATDGWCSDEDDFSVGNEVEGNNLTGFSALPAGHFDGGSTALGILADFWSATLNDYGGASYLTLCFYYPHATLNASDQRNGRSVRCIRNERETASENLAENSSDTLLSPDYQGKSCPQDSTVTDIDGNIYPTILIGKQCWMRENLRTTAFANGAKIKFSKKEKSAETPYRYNPMDCDTCVKTYGYLYNWAAAVNLGRGSSANPSQVQGVCPDGWHVPSRAEWIELADFVASQPRFSSEGDKAQADVALCEAKYWKSDCYVTKNSSQSETSGFDARPAGLFEGYFSDSGYNAYFWSCTPKNSTMAHFFGIGASILGDYHRYYYVGDGFSVRCVRD